MMQSVVRCLPFRVLSFGFLLLVPWSVALAQLTDSTQTTQTVPGGSIAKSLEEQVGAGQGDMYTYGSSTYLVKRDPARSIRRGRQLFQRKFTAEQGLGPRVNSESSGNIKTHAALGAGLTDSCAACHGRPRGSAGFGGDVATRPDSRDAPHLFGLGLAEMLADEITADLRRTRDEALAQAAAGGTSAASSPTRRSRRSGRSGRSGSSSSVTLPLTSKGIDFGTIVANPDGTLDTSGVDGVNPDLRVRPFFHDGRSISIREFIVGALKDEMGLQASDPVLCAVTDPDAPTEMISIAGMVFDPSQDTFERPPVCDPHDDADGDGVANEIDPALVDHMEFYLLNYFKPGRGPVNRYTRGGLALMKQIGCTGCHVQDLVVERDRRVADVETRYDPKRGIFNRLFATASTRFDVVSDGEDYPQLVPKEERFVVRDIFTDFKRHDLGPAFHERQYDGTVVKAFVTEPLWGVGSTAPYGHDGRSINLREVILRHGGEAQRSRNRFARLGFGRQQQILAFLDSLVLFPPDDTASNLNPGVPRTKNPQDPAQHGSINLGALFQIAEEGAE